MPETPISYFPDVKIQWTPEVADEFETEIELARSKREQRRAVGPTNGLMRWGASSAPLKYADREIVRAFLRARRGRKESFYFFSPIPEKFTDVSAGSVTAQSRIILPFKDSTITDVRVAGATKAFTVLPLLPRVGTYAALFLDGVDDYVNCGTSATLRTTGDMTFAAWVYRKSNGAVAYGIMSNETINASGTSFWVTSDGKLTLSTSQAAARVILTLATPVLALNTWQHVAVVRSGTGLTCYLNGVSIGTLAGSTAPVVATAMFAIGRLGGSADAQFHGMVSDCRFYDTALSGAEILNIFNNVAAPSANLRGHWRLVEGTGTTAIDHSGTGNTGTLTSGPTWVAGEDEVTFTAGAQTGAVTATLIGRERVIARNALDRIAQGFIPNAADLNAVFPIAIQQLV